MVYRVIGVISGSALDGLSIGFVEFHESSGSWTYTLRHGALYPYSAGWVEKLRGAAALSAMDYQLLDAGYGHYVGSEVNRFIAEFDIQYQVQLIASHGHTAFHFPAQRITAQLGKGSAIAAETGINVVSDLRSLDVALGGEGAPIVPIGEQLLLGDYLLFLNLGGNANISVNQAPHPIAFDICAANTVLNMLSKAAGKSYDDGGQFAEKGNVNETLLNALNELPYYQTPFPKSLANNFTIEVIYPLLDLHVYDIDDALRTYVEHICIQVSKAVEKLKNEPGFHASAKPNRYKMMVTGGGAKNAFLVKRLEEHLAPLGVKAEIPINELVEFKEAIIIGLIGVLRWREENNTLATVTGASRNSIGGAIWMGQEA